MAWNNRRPASERAEVGTDPVNYPRCRSWLFILHVITADRTCVHLHGLGSLSVHRCTSTCIAWLRPTVRDQSSAQDVGLCEAELHHAVFDRRRHVNVVLQW